MTRQLAQLLVAFARTQRGLLSEADAVQLTRRKDAIAWLVATGMWQQVLPGVLAAAAVTPSLELLESATRLWGRVGMLSHFSAARREGIWVPEDPRAWLSVGYRSTLRSRDEVVVFRTRNLVTLVRSDGFHQWTPPSRTIVDLGAHLTRKQLDAVLLSAIRLERTSAATVDAVAASLRGRQGVAMVREAAALWTPERQSLLEDGLHADVCAVVGHGVTRQHAVRRADGSLLAVLDVAVEELMLGFDADGLYFHSTDAQLAHDQKRDRGCLGRGYQTVRFREGPLSDHAQVQREIRAIVERRRHQLRIA